MGSRKTGAWVPASLVALTIVPVLAGAVRVAGLASDAPITLENARFVASPVPVVLHILCASMFGVVGAFQFWAQFRKRRPDWHRMAGRALVVCGLMVALSGLWMTLYYPWPVGDGRIVFGLRLVFGSAMLACILLGIDAIRRRKFGEHSAWMIRGYAIGMGAGTQVLTHLPWLILVGVPMGRPRAVMMGAGWVINVAVAEWIIRAPTGAWRTAFETLRQTCSGWRSPRAARPR